MTDFAAITARAQQIWSKGDFNRLAVGQVIVGELLCEAVDVIPGERVLDVAAGSGNTSLAAARRGGDVLATDFVPALLEHAERRAQSEGLELRTQVADAQALPFPDAAFDLVVSSFGAMFAPDQERTAAELLRVCRPGGRIGMANWTPDGMVGEMFRTTAAMVPPAPGLRPPTLWGTEDHLQKLLGEGTSELRITRRQATMRHRSPESMLEHFRTWFGPTQAAFEALDTAGQEKLAAEMLAVYGRYNRSGGVPVIAPCDYLEVVAVRA